MHISLMGMSVFKLLSALKARRGPALIASSAAALFYAVLTGASGSAMRAVIMLFCRFLAMARSRSYDMVSSIALALLILVFERPYIVFQSGFQLSFLVTFGIVCTADVIMKRFEGNKIVYKILGALLVPIVAQIWVIPLQMFYFNTISTYSFFANVSIMPFLSVISFGGFVSSVLSIISLSS